MTRMIQKGRSPNLRLEEPSRGYAFLHLLFLIIDNHPTGIFTKIFLQTLKLIANIKYIHNNIFLIFFVFIPE
mgnify:CR=1 FL=1